MIYIFTGHLGSGKSLAAITLAVEEYAYKGRRVASNMTINWEACMPRESRYSAIKLPGIPRLEDLVGLGSGYDLSEKYDENKFGLIVLDEAGGWLNSRDWADKERRGLFRWITHARKLGWDVALIIQDFESLDTQIRKSVCEVVVVCRRLDRVKIPYLPIRLPKKFMAIGRYGGPRGAMYKLWFSSAISFDWFNTREAVAMDEIDTDAGPVDMRASSSMLSAWHTLGRYLPPRLRLADWISVGVGMLILLTIGAFGMACLGRSPWQAAREAWRRFRLSRRPSPLLLAASP